jgi:hypothetical protein
MNASRSGVCCDRGLEGGGGECCGPIMHTRPALHVNLDKNVRISRTSASVAADDNRAGQQGWLGWLGDSHLQAHLQANCCWSARMVMQLHRPYPGLRCLWEVPGSCRP